MEYSKDLGFDIKSRNDIFDVINNIVHHNYALSLSCSKELLIAIALSYFVLSKEDVVVTDKFNSNINEKHTSNIDSWYLYNFFNKSNVHFSNYSYTSIIAIIRNCLCHGSTFVDLDKEVVKISSSYNGVDFNEEIPFSFFFDYLKEKLSFKKNANNGIYIFTSYKNPSNHSYYSPDTSFPDYLFLNGIAPLKITPITLNGEKIELDVLKSFVSNFEYYFRKNNINKYKSFEDYYLAFSLEIDKLFKKVYPNTILQVDVDFPKEDADIFHSAYTYKEKSSNFNSFDLCSSLNKTLFDLNGGVTNFLPFYYDTLVSFQNLKDLYGSYLYYPLSDGINTTKDTDLSKVQVGVSFIRNNECLTLTSLLYTLGINAILVNDDSLKSYQNEGMPESFLFYSYYNSHNDEEKVSSLDKSISDKEIKRSVYRERLKHDMDSESKKRIDMIINGIDADITSLEGEKHVLQRRINSPSTKLNPYIYDIKDFIKDDTLLDDGTNKYYLLEDENKIRTIIRNAFAHPGRIKVIYNEDLNEYGVEIIDINEYNVVTGRGYAPLNDFLYYITKGSKLYEVEYKRSA